MKRIVILGEGQTEQAFCREVLQPYFSNKGISLETPTIKKTRGGLVPWADLQKEIITLLRSPTCIVTTLLDYYGIKDYHEFPEWDQAKKIPNKNQRMESLEKGMGESLPEGVRHRFVPYLQLHEFEALLFCDQRVFDENFEESDYQNRQLLIDTFREFENPEDINDSPHSAPSKRLQAIFRQYDKVVLGSLIAQEIGLRTVTERCPRFKEWLYQLETATNTLS